jgi:hypothetical protein
MGTGIRLKVMLVTVLLAGWLLGPSLWVVGNQMVGSSPNRFAWWQSGLLIFGVFNALVETPGTTVVRVAAVLLSAAILFVPPSGALIIVLWLVWPPAYMGAWALAAESRNQKGTDDGDSHADRSARIAVASIIAAVAIASFMYRFLVAHNLQQTAALFIGIPSLIAIVVVFGVAPRSATGTACKAVTIGLLVSMVFLQEGMLCVLMSAPLFYAVAIVIVALARLARGPESHSITHSLAVLLIVIPLSLEGVTPMSTVGRHESVTEAKVIHAPTDAVARALFAQPRFERRLPVYLRAGFPMAESTEIRTVGNETRWVIRVRGGEMRLNGMEPREGDLVLALEEQRPGLLRWRAVSDSSHMTHFLFWREIVVTWEAVTPESTRVTWTLQYDRGLDPAWYFGPMERYAVGLAAGYLIDTVATP